MIVRQLKKEELNVIFFLTILNLELYNTGNSGKQLETSQSKMQLDSDLTL